MSFALNDKQFEKYLIMMVFFLALLSLGGLWSSISIFLPLISNEFQISMIEISLLFVVMLLPVPLTELIALPFKRYGKEMVVLIGLLILSIFGTFHPLIPNFYILLIFRFIAATGFGLLFMYHTPILAEYTQPSQKTFNTLVLMSGLVTGAMGSSFFSIYLYVFFKNSWQFAVSFWGIIAIIALFLWCIYLIKKE